MLRLAAVALILAIVAAFLGQGGLASLATQAAIVLAVIAVILLIVGLLSGRGGGVPPAV